MIAVLQVGGVFLIFGTAWFVRAWLATGNPVYPSGVASAVVSVAHEHHLTAQGLLMKYLSIPWAMHFRGHPFFESASDYPMGIVLVLFIPFWVLVRCSLSRQAKVVLLFCAIYLVYWSYAIPMIRYGIAPIALIAMFTAYFLIMICRAMPRWMGISAITASVYVGLFSICGIAINEINEVQLRYLAHRISAEQFLVEALPPMRSLQYLKQAAKPGDRIFGFNNCALAYAPNQELFACILMESGNWERAKAELAVYPYRFLIMPESQLGIVPAGWKEVYADPAFHVFRNMALAD